MTTTARTRKLKRSVAALTGRIVVLPEHPNWDQARLAWNLAVDQQPAAVVFPESAEDVMAAVELAKAFGLRVSAQGTGHNAAPLGPLEDTVLVKTERMRGIEIDPEAQVARIDAGVRSVELVEAAAQHGLAPLAGSSPDVGVVGYTLGGGLSWFGRKHGLAASHVHAIELVTADGRLVRADREHEPELFWALRGGGGSFGIVTALELRLIPVREAYAGILWWPIERDREVLHATGDGILLEKLPPEAIDELNQTAGAASSSPLISLEVRHLGGELGRAHSDSGALAAVDADYVLYAVGIAPTPQTAAQVRAHIEVVADALRPWAAEHAYLNFAETKRDPHTLWTETAQQRHRRIKATLDPDNLIRSNQPVH
jgi:FAD binding domain